MRLRAFFLALVLLLPLPARASDVDPALERDIRTLLALTGTQALMSQMLDQMMANFATMPGMTDSLARELRAEMRVEELEGEVVAIYARHFTREDIAALVAFYQSPVGKKLVAEQPVILQESMAAGQAWGMQAAQRVTLRLQSR